MQLCLLGAMYQILFVDRVNTATAAPLIALSVLLYCSAILALRLWPDKPFEEL